MQDEKKKLFAECRALIREAVAQSINLVAVHVMQEVTALCDRIVILGRGRVVACGTADELVAQSGERSLEEAFVRLLGTDEGLAA